MSTEKKNKIYTVFELANVNKDVYNIVEKQMRPDAFSKAGFLNKDESLLQVASNDKKFLESVGITYDKIVERLESFLHRYQQIKSNKYLEGIKKGIKDSDDSDDSCTDKYKDDIPLFGLRIKTGEVIKDKDGSIYYVDKCSYRGYQYCPFGSSRDDVAPNEHLTCNEHADTDYIIMNCSTGKYITFPELSLHLIKDHQFFQGFTEYRLDPQKAIKVLNILPNVDYKTQYTLVKKWTWESLSSLPKRLLKMEEKDKWFDIDKSFHLKGLISSDDYNDYTDDVSKKSEYLHVAIFEWSRKIKKHKYNDNSNGYDSSEPPAGFKTFTKINVEKIYQVDDCPVVVQLFTYGTHCVPYARFRRKTVRVYSIE